MEREGKGGGWEAWRGRNMDVGICSIQCQVQETSFEVKENAGGSLPTLVQIIDCTKRCNAMQYFI